MSWLRIKRKVWVWWTKYCIRMGDAAEFADYYEMGLTDLCPPTRETRKRWFRESLARKRG